MAFVQRCCSLRIACYLVAIYNLVSTMVGLGLLIFYLWDAHLSWNTVAVAVLMIALFCVSIALLKGIRQRNRSLIAICLWATLGRICAEIAIMIFLAVIYCWLQAKSDPSEDEDPLFTFIRLIGVGILVTLTFDVLLQGLSLAVIKRYHTSLPADVHFESIPLEKPQHKDPKDVIHKIDFSDQYSFLRNL